jgi:hypothetical protein
MIVANGLAHRPEVTGRRTTTVIVLRATVVIAVIVATVIVMALLRAAVVVIIARVGAGQQRRRADHQHAQPGHQTFRHFHRVFPHGTNSKKGFRTMF